MFPGARSTIITLFYILQQASDKMAIVSFIIIILPSSKKKRVFQYAIQWRSYDFSDLRIFIQAGESWDLLIPYQPWSNIHSTRLKIQKFSDILTIRSTPPKTQKLSYIQIVRSSRQKITRKPKNTQPTKNYLNN